MSYHNRGRRGRPNYRGGRNSSVIGPRGGRMSSSSSAMTRYLEGNASRMFIPPPMESQNAFHMLNQSAQMSGLNDYLEKMNEERIRTAGESSGSKKNLVENQSKRSAESQSITHKESPSKKKQKTHAEVLKEPEEIIKNDYEEFILHIDAEEDDRWVDDPWYLKQKYCEKEGYPNYDGKNRSFYIQVLKNTRSIVFEDIPSHPSNELIACQEYFDHNSIAYSKASIMKVYTLIEWGNDPFKTRRFRVPNSTEVLYNYFDYKAAWKYAFYYQNVKKKHTWLFRFNEAFMQETKSIPRWFYGWWKIFGPPFDMLPEELQEPYGSWTSSHPIFGKLSTKTYKGQHMLYYMMEFSIPWIWKWELKVTEDDLGIPSLYRSFNFLWWKRFEIEPVLEKTQEKTFEYQKLQNAEEMRSQTSTANPTDIFRKNLQRKYPHLSEADLALKCIDMLKASFSKFRSSEEGHEQNLRHTANSESHPEEESQIRAEDVLDALSEQIQEDESKAKEKEKAK